MDTYSIYVYIIYKSIKKIVIFNTRIKERCIHTNF